MATLPAIIQVKNYLNSVSVKERIGDMLGKRSTAFTTSLINIVSNSKQLQVCNPESIMKAAMISATFNLPIESSLGFCAIVPYGKDAQFQLQYKGLIQLAIRSAQYKGMNVSEVFEDEIEVYNPITGKITFVSDFNKTEQRAKSQVSKITGYYAWFELNNGFRKALYMTNAQVEYHANKYSKSYQYDKSKGYKNSKWTTDFAAMAKKTLIKLLLSKWGILSIEMQDAIRSDQKVYAEDTESYGDNPKVIDTSVNNVFKGDPEKLPSAAATPEATPEDKVISEAQVKRLYAIGGSSGLSNEAVKPIYKAKGYNSANDILIKDYESIIKEIEETGSFKKDLKKK